MMSNSYNDRDDFIYTDEKNPLEVTLSKNFIEKLDAIITQLYTSADLDLEKLDDDIYDIASEMGIDMPKGKLNIKRRS